MELNGYQQEARQTAIYDQGVDETMELLPIRLEQLLRLVYVTTKLNGEAGEVGELIGKAIRDDGGVLSQERIQAIAAELGDVLWYVSQTAHEIGYDLEGIAVMNLEKLRMRAEEGKLHGSGSNR